jgi:hypothetical protein
MKQLATERSNRNWGNDLSLPGASLEEKGNRADRNLTLINGRRHHRAEGSTR